MYFYRKVYPKSWQIIKSNLSLLFFGLFASILGFHEIKVLFDLNDANPDFLGSVILFWGSLFKTIAVVEISLGSLPALLGLIGMFILLAIVVILAVSSQGALIYSTSLKGKLKFLDCFQKGLEKFWPLFGLNIINTLIGYFFVSFVLNPLISFISISNVWLLHLVLSIFAFFILLPLIIIISFITRYGVAYIVLKNQKVMEAFINSWYLFKINWMITLENAIFLSIVTILFFLAMFTAMVFIFTPFLILSSFMSFSYTLFWLIIAIGALMGIIVFIIGTAIYGAYYNIVWSNVFLELTSKGVSQSKLHRLATQYVPGCNK